MELFVITQEPGSSRGIVHFSIRREPTDGLIRQGYDSPRSTLARSFEPTNAEFQACLENNALKVDDFFNKRFDVYSGDLAVLEKRYPESSIPTLDEDGIVELRDTLLEVKIHLRKLGWYAEVNRRGFRKILKKLDKKSGADYGQKWGVKTFKKAFAVGTDIDSRLTVVDRYLKLLGNETPEEIKSSAASAVSSASELDEMKRIIGGGIGSTENLAMTKKETAHAVDVEELEKARDSPHLAELLQKAQDKGQLTVQTLNSLLYRAVSRANLPCIRELVQWLPAFDRDISHRNVIHRYLLHVGTHHGEAKSSAALQTLLDSMKLDQREALSAPDSHGRTPLHYVAQFGLLAHLDIVLTFLKKWGVVAASTPLDGIQFRDCEGLTPVHLAVLGGHVKCVKLISDTTPQLSDGALVLAASRQDYAAIVKVLLDAGLQCGFQDREGETPLYVCARMNLMDSLKVLLSHDVSQLSVAESSRGWTPLFAAAAEGHTEVAKELMQQPECDLVRRDNDGWRAHETAAFRGHVALCKLIMGKLPLSLDTDDDQSLAPTPDKAAKPVPVPTDIAHPDKTLVLVTLGSTDVRDIRGSVSVNAKPFSDLDTHLTLVVRATNVEHPDGLPTQQYEEVDGGCVELPVEEHTTEPIRFYTSDASKVQVVFDLVPSRDSDSATAVRNTLARGVATVESLDPLQHSGRRCLRDVHEVPLVERNSMAIVGSVRFRVLIVTPFSHPNMKVRSQEYWNSLATRVIGHRGLGKNTNPRGREELTQQLQMGENTLESFLLASKLGASHVEFDVQLTKDHQPVIYHDFLVSEAGIDVPMHALTSEQFSSLHAPPPKHTDRRKGHRGVPKRSESLDVGRSHRHRAFSVSDGLERVSEGDKVLEGTKLVDDDQDADDHIAHRMKFTRDYKMKGFKGNSRGISIQAPFTTLREVLQSLPPNVGCNIECKYPMLDEGQAEEMDEFAIDLNIWADKVLECVFEYGSNREIIFSSFHPDVCLMLNHKQGGVPMIGKVAVNPVGYPTLFLTESGTAPMYDIRASSLQEAIRFCKDWNLLGLVSECSPFVMCPRLIQVVKRAGLVCVSYGALNNNPEIAKTQIKHGVDAVIVDSVKAVHTGLLETETAGTVMTGLPTVEGSPPDESAIEKLS